MTAFARARALAWPITTVMLTAACTLLVTQEWNADAAPGASESTIVTIAPQRVLDTRNPVNVGLPGPFVSPVGQKLQVTGSITTTTGTATVVPTGATGVLLNVTAVNTSANGFISIRPGDATGAPATSSLNVTAGITVPNAVTVALPTSGAHKGQIDITFDALGTAGPTTDILIDVVGYSTSAGLQELVDDVAGKASATQTVKFSGMELTDTGTFETGTTNGCALDYLGRSGRLSLVIPVGATITNVTGVFFDENAASVYTARLRRVTTTQFSDSPLTLATVTNATANLAIATVSKDLTPAVPEVVEPNERFEVDFDDGVASFGNGICSVSVSYVMLTGAAPLVAPEPASDAPPAPCETSEACRVGTP